MGRAIRGSFLREPLERGKITLTRVHGQAELPAAFLFMGTANLCPCGRRTDLDSDCQCLSSDRESLLEKTFGTDSRSYRSTLDTEARDFDHLR